MRACGEETECSIAGLLALRNGSVIFASANRHGIGLLDGDWKVATYQPAPLPAYGGLEDYGRFLLSPDGMTLRFSYQQDGAEAAWFSVPPRKLVPGASSAGFAGAPPDDQSMNITGLGTDQVLLNRKKLELDEETGMRVAAIKGTHRFAFATEWSLYLFDGEGKRQWKILLPASPEAINVSGDGKLAVAALIDGTIRWFRLSDGQERLALFPHPDRKRWILWTPEGYYDCSPGADDLLGFQTSHGETLAPDFQPASTLKAKYYSPEAVSKALR